MMINDAMKGGLGYDPFDPTSFPYGFTAESLHLEDLSFEVAPDLDPLEMIHELAKNYDDDGPADYRQLDMALRLFVKLTNDVDGSWGDIPLPDLFAACIHTAMIWERG